MPSPSFTREDTAASRAEWGYVVHNQCAQSELYIAERLSARLSEQVPRQTGYPQLEKLVQRAISQRCLMVAAPGQDEDALFNRLKSELGGIVTNCERQLEQDRDFGPFEISDEVAADCKWALDERTRTGFRDRPLNGDYVAIYEGDVIGSGLSETQLRDQLAAQYHVDPKRFVIEYIGKGY